MKVFLLGLPGAGKTTLGKQVAKLLSIPFADLDEAIEKSEKRKISEIFKKPGEDYFRKVESALLKKWASSESDFLMATGGGTPCYFNNIQIMNEAGVTIFLDVPPMEIANRISASENQDRPLFINMNFDVLKDQVETLRTRRVAYYKQAQNTISKTKIEAAEILSFIKKETQP